MATAFGVAAVAHWVGHLSWPIAFVLGTAVGPTDASAATSIARRLGLPRRLLTILEGEALFNDATALVLYAAAVAAATTGHFSAARTAGTIVYSTAAGGRSAWPSGWSAAGCATGSTTRRSRSPARSCWPTPPICRPQAIHASGVLAAVTAGLYLGWHSSGGAFSARSRLQSGAFWETLVFLVNAALFVLVGLSFHTFSTQARGPVGRLALTGVAVVSTVIVVRLAWMWAFGWLIRPRRRDQAVAGQPGWRERLILGWSGMRGAITLAALLAVPELTDCRAPTGRARRHHLPGVRGDHRDAGRRRA